MAIKNFYFSQIADLRIEGVGIHASYSVNLTVTDENTPGGKTFLSRPLGKVMRQKQLAAGIFYFGAK